MPFSCFLFRPRKSRERRRKCSHTNVSNASVIRFSTPPAQTAHVRFHSRKRVHTRFSEKDRAQALTRRNRGVLDGGAITTLGAFHTFRKPCVARCQNGKLCRFWVLVGGALPKNAESLRSSDALMRVAAPRRRGPAGLRDLFRFCRNCGLYILRSGLSACARHGWYHYPRRALRASETLDSRLSKRLFCRFLRPGSHY